MKQNVFPERVFILIIVLFFLVCGFSFAAEITVPRLEMATRGAFENDDFVLSSLISADLALSGGYKYAFLLGFSMEAVDIAKAFAYGNSVAAHLESGDTVTADDYNALADRLNNQAFIGFRTAKATARDLFGAPLELSYFIGEGDDFCTGEDFGSRLGLSPFGTEFRGFFYFPEGIGGAVNRRYNGIHGARGTGLSLALTKWNFFVPVIYAYQDFDFLADFFSGTGSNLYSEDLRLLFHYRWFSMEVFGGVSHSPGTDASFRGGLMVYLAPGNGVEFFTQAGIPAWIQGEEFNIDKFFFLMESRLRLRILSVFLTFFYHPVEYLHIVTPEERGKAEVNIKFQAGKPESSFAGGIEAGGDLNIEGLDSFNLRVSTFGSFVADGLKWEAKITLKPLEYSVPKEMIDIFVGVRTAF